MTIRRIADADYSAPGYYLITAVSTQRLPAFGELRSDGVHPSRLGEVILDEWRQIPLHWPWLDAKAFALMPDHVHFVVGWTTRPVQCRIDVGNIVGAFKAGVTRSARRLQIVRANELVWQRSYDVRFLKSQTRLDRAVEYVDQNWMVAWQSQPGAAFRTTPATA